MATELARTGWRSRPASPKNAGKGEFAMGLWIALGLLALVLLYAVIVYNRLVRLRALVREGFSGITVQLRRRADLVPNLVETVQGYATHERSTLDEVTAHRADATRDIAFAPLPPSAFSTMNVASMYLPR